MTIVLTEDNGPVRHVVLNRPEKRNAFNGELVRATGEALRAAADDTPVRGVVVRGGGPMFSSGMDLSALAALAEAPESLRAFRRACLDAWNLAEEMTKPTVCAIHGACIGGAMELALVNRGGATTAELMALAREIAAGVRERFGVALHPEPVLVGHEW